MSKILVVEDDQINATNLQTLLSADSHTVEVVFDGIAGKERLDVFQYDLIVLDWQLPGLSGVDLCRSFRQSGGNSPILMLTGKDTIDDKENGLDAGADDYITKPFHPRELLARVRALLRRSTVVQSGEIRVGDLVLDRDKRMVTSNGNAIALQPLEFAVLEFFMRHPAKVFGTDEIIKRVWSDDTEIGTEALYSCINRLRRKLDSGRDKTAIRSVRGVGYCLDVEGNQS
jgi:two-component system, OmpR family, manganese sensing response regulator